MSELTIKTNNVPRSVIGEVATSASGSLILRLVLRADGLGERVSRHRTDVVLEPDEAAELVHCIIHEMAWEPVKIRATTRPFAARSRASSQR